MLALLERPGRGSLVRVAPSTRAIISWNAAAPAGRILIDVHRTDATIAQRLPYAEWSPGGRKSLDGADERTRLAIDVVRSDVPFSGIGVTSDVALDAIAIATPAFGARRPAYRSRVAPLPVEPLAQRVAGREESARSWCSPTALAMLLRFHGCDLDVAAVADGVRDDAYAGTGNWAFNAAFAGAHGLRACVAYLDGLDHVAAFVAAGLPVAISIAWRPGDLPGAPLPDSEGHLIVVRGFDPAWAHVNDPAHPARATRYDRVSLDRVFRGHGGVAYLVAPRERAAELVALANVAPAAAAS